MKKVSYILFLFMLRSFILISQPSVTWQQCYGGSEKETTNNLFRTFDGGYLISGTANSNDGDVTNLHLTEDAWIVKLDSAFNIQWQKCLGGSGYDGGFKTIETASGYVIGCYTGSNDGNVTNFKGLTDFWFNKLDFSGNLIWQKCYGGSLVDLSYSICETVDNGFVMSGYTLSFDGDVTGHNGSAGQTDLWLVKVDQFGDTLWTKCLGGGWSEQNCYVTSDSNNYIYTVCTTGSRNGDISCNGNYKYVWVTKLDSIGQIIWDKCYGGSTYELINSIFLKDSKLLMSGSSQSDDFDLTHNYGLDDAWILMIDTSGTLLMSKSFGGSSTDIFYDAKFSYDGSIIAGGETYSNDFDVTKNFQANDCWLVSIDTLGNILWENTYGGNGVDRVRSILISDSTFIIGATTNSVSGNVSGLHGTQYADIWLAKFSTAVSVPMIIRSPISIYPNPASNHIYIRGNFNNSLLTLINLEGRIILEKSIDSEEQVDISTITNGCYIVQIQSEDNITRQKIIISKEGKFSN